MVTGCIGRLAVSPRGPVPDAPVHPVLQIFAADGQLWADAGVRMFQVKCRGRPQSTKQDYLVTHQSHSWIPTPRGPKAGA